MVEIKDLKVGQRFVECYPTNIWFGDFVNVDIHYSERKIVKINEKSIVVVQIMEDGKESNTDNWKHIDKHLFWSKKKMEEQIVKNSPILVKQFDNMIVKYTNFAFEKWYLLAQRRMVDLTLQLVEGNRLSYEGVKSVKGIIKDQNEFLEKKLKDLKL